MSTIVVLSIASIFGCTSEKSNVTTQNSVEETTEDSTVSNVTATSTSEAIPEGYDDEDYKRVLVAESGTSADEGVTVVESTKENTIYLKESKAESSATGVTVDGSVVTITAPGEYIVTGTLNDGQLVVDCQEKGTVEIILNNASISNSANSPIYIIDSKKVLLILAENSDNTLNDAESYTYVDTEAEEPSACLFSKEDLVIAGAGSLVVNGNFNNGIASKDTLKITGGNITVNAANNGIKGKDCLMIAGGAFQINAQDDAVHSNGTFELTGGTLNLASGDDGIHADGTLTITDGTIDISQSYEGVESPEIIFNGGTTHIVASDDGTNAAGGSATTSSGTRPGGMMSTSTGTMVINDGYLYIDADGDGLDANGNLTMNGGCVIVEGPTNDGNTAVDYDGEFIINGGYLIASGSSGMVEGVSTSSTENSITAYFNSALSAGSTFAIKDSSGNMVMAFEVSKSSECFLFASSELQTGEIYTICTGGVCDGTSQDGLYTEGTYTGGTELGSFTVSGTVTTYGTGGGMGNMGGTPGGNKGWR